MSLDVFEEHKNSGPTLLEKNELFARAMRCKE